VSANGRNRLSRADRNEQAFQAHNRRRVAFEESGGVWVDEPLPFACECDDPTCNRAIELSIADYEHAVAPPSQFVVAPGHQDPAVEEVVEAHDAYLVVSKDDLRRPGR
jgi:hypothetical protein